MRYWDFSLPSAEVHPTTISKYNTALQLALIGATTAMPLITADLTTAMTVMQYVSILFWVTFLRRVLTSFKVSGRDYHSMEWCKLYLYEGCCENPEPR
jgi:hypothetical protein